MLAARIQTSGRSGGVDFQLSSPISSSCNVVDDALAYVTTMLTTTITQIAWELRQRAIPKH